MVDSDAETYVITAWREGKQWRYRARHIRSGEDKYFVRLEDVAEMMENRTGLAPLPRCSTRKKS